MSHFESLDFSNHSDRWGRYPFDHQPLVPLWNLSCLSQALLPLVPHEAAEAALADYERVLGEHFAALMRATLGLAEARREDGLLVTDLLTILQANQVDSEIDRLLSLLRTPFAERPDQEGYAGPSPEWGRGIVIGCSS